MASYLGSAAGGLGGVAATGLGVGTPLGLSAGGLSGGLVEEETTVASWKKLPLPLLIPLLLLMIPASLVLATVVVVVVVTVVSRTIMVFLVFMFPNLKRKQKEEYQYPETYPDEPYPSQGPPESSQYSKNRRDTSATPYLTMDQVQKLVSVVFSALTNQECLQRLLCEAGSLVRSDSSTSTVVRSIEDYVPKPLQKSFNIFAKETNCSKYVCGDLKAK